MHTPVPHFEPEIIATAATRRNGDNEKVATTSLGVITVRGVKLSSRYGKAHEFETMIFMIDRLIPDRLAGFIESLWCDSKANACYTLKLRTWSDELVPEIARQLEEACIQKDGGHNGITLEGPANDRLDINPNWNEETA